MELIDTHCHLDVAEFDPDRESVITSARARGVSTIVVPGIHRAGWDGLLALCGRHPSLYPALGLHPVYLSQHVDADVQALITRIEQRPPIALGEIGLDFYLTDLDRSRQHHLFEAQLEIARERGLPVLLHVRKAHQEVLSTLKRIPVSGGIVHAFSGGIEEAKRYIALGLRLGFGGMLTFARSSKLRRLAAALPLDSIVLETDAPDLTVAAHRGERNSPEYLPDVLAALAEVRGEDPAAVAAITTANARDTLHLPTRRPPPSRPSSDQ